MSDSSGQPGLFSLFPDLREREGPDGPEEGFLVQALGEHAIITVADMTGRIVYVNQKFIELSGYAREELIGEQHRKVRADEEIPGFYDGMRAAVRAGQTWHGEIKNCSKTGGVFWIRATVVPHLGPDGKPEKFLSVGTDITATKLTEANRQQRLSFDQIKDEICLLWPDTLQVFYGNRKVRTRLRSLGHTTSSLQLSDVVSGVSDVALASILAPVLQGKRNWVVFPASIRRGDGESTPVEVTVQMIVPEGEKPRLLAHARDISKRTRAESVKQQFVSNVSHELRTPLTTIKGAFELIRSGLCATTPERAGQLAEMGLKNTKRLERLIEDLLDMERIASGRMVSKLNRLDVVELIEDCVEGLRDYKPERAITFDVQTEVRPVWVRGDETRLGKAVRNLLTNAVKFSHPGGRVEIAIQRADTRVMIFVRDKGIGIPEHAMGHLFDPFTQADSTDQRPVEGAGLGLSISRAIIEEHGGEIELHSVEGEGTEVAFCLLPHTAEDGGGIPKF